MLIDTNFDFRSDTPPGKDPDARSPTLRRYHKILWSKPLPNGKVLDLRDTTPGIYLHHHSDLGDFKLTSDSAIPSFRKETRLSPIFSQIPEELEAFVKASYTIGGMMVFPGNRVNGRATINGARGLNHQIKDRFDLTLECIRRHYRNKQSPLSETLGLYPEYFQLFDDFQGFVEFFLLQDIVTEDYEAVKFFLPFEKFEFSPVPDDIASYMSYRKMAIDFIEARNTRIKAWADSTRSATPTTPT